jgi:glutamyl-tRNA reductase
MICAPRLTALGLSYRTTPVGQREKAALDDECTRRLLRRLMADPRVSEAAAVSTCNRTEVYVVSDAARHGAAAAEEALVACSRISAAELACARFAFQDEAAAGHLFRVTGGLDSMVLGESEVQGQVRAAAAMAREEGAVGPLLAGLFKQALVTGGRVRRETQIASGPTSVSSLAVDIARGALPDLGSRRVLLVGAGRMAESTGRALGRQGARELVVANRTLSTAQGLAAQLGGRAAGLDALPAELERADMVVCSTDAPYPIVRQAELASALAARPERPLVIIDLAVPRDVEPAVASMRGALLYDIDDIERAMQQNIEGRRRDLVRAEAIVADEVTRFRAWRLTKLSRGARLRTAA